ncbi:erythroblast NAD(P)(+)--arginine ADP-ribosyltransferase-like [Micropterus salmoides]|uniref:erythroblast NAD(P)(+)--arginine ADP-ribosyltransferase-like n=1 Tax=Micropterus salmoides TaxID=27706 RepID=UPI0018EE0995|nr:erythroblast NAD(P)(+)--arginine ADP-ribosyltransferase-like [Micropterus salmoides]
MVDTSVDDMYHGCEKEMENRVKTKYLKKEMSTFSAAWTKAEECSKKKLANREEMLLTKDHMLAICLYTDNDVYQQFNDAVRTGRSQISSSFKFHSLHFLLTSAIKVLNCNVHCRITYRRTNVKFIGKVNQIFRFGSFTSSSKRKDLKTFGNKTCFKIKTCFGAFLKHYSYFPKEEEVLIPPYEMFRITDSKGQIKGLEDCEVVYVVESLGPKNNLNCAALAGSKTG